MRCHHATNPGIGVTVAGVDPVDLVALRGQLRESPFSFYSTLAEANLAERTQPTLASEAAVAKPPTLFYP